MIHLPYTASSQACTAIPALTTIQWKGKLDRPNRDVSRELYIYIYIYILYMTLTCHEMKNAPLTDTKNIQHWPWKLWGAVCNMHTFVDRSNFFSNKSHFCLTKVILSTTKLFLSDKSIFCQTKVDFVRQKLILSDKSNFVIDKITFVWQKQFCLDKNCFCQQK